MYKIRITYHKMIQKALYAVLRVVEADVDQSYEILKDPLTYKLVDTIETIPRKLYTDCFDDVNRIITAAKNEVAAIRSLADDKNRPLPEPKEIEL